MKGLAVALRVFGCAWGLLAGLSILIGFAVVLFRYGPGEFWRIVKPFNVLNLIVICAMILPALIAFSLADCINKRT